MIEHVSFVMITVKYNYWGYTNIAVEVVRHIEMPKAALQKSICHLQKLEMILK